MPSMRDQIDSLDPETYAREAQAIARDAVRRAKELGLPIPESVCSILAISEEELAMQRRRAMEDEAETFEKELESLINKYSKESGSNTPDFILANYLNDCLLTYNTAVNRRDKWYYFKPWSR